MESVKETVQIAVVGSRSFNTYNILEEKLDTLLKEKKIDDKRIVIVSGGANGADTLAEFYAQNKGYDKLIFEADWEKYGKSAGFRRNETIVENADIVVAFWDGQSRGTKDTIDKARDKGIETIIIKIEPTKYTDWSKNLKEMKI
jgi:hypothetical protein